MFKLTILRPDKKIFEGEVNSLVVPGLGGGMEILSHHAPLVGVLKSGTIKYDDKTYELKDAALLEVGGNSAKILIA